MERDRQIALIESRKQRAQEMAKRVFGDDEARSMITRTSDDPNKPAELVYQKDTVKLYA